MDCDKQFKTLSSTCAVVALLAAVRGVESGLKLEQERKLLLVLESLAVLPCLCCLDGNNMEIDYDREDYGDMSWCIRL